MLSYVLLFHYSFSALFCQRKNDRIDPARGQTGTRIGSPLFFFCIFLSGGIAETAGEKTKGGNLSLHLYKRFKTQKFVNFFRMFTKSSQSGRKKAPEGGCSPEAGRANRAGAVRRMQKIRFTVRSPFLFFPSLYITNEGAIFQPVLEKFFKVFQKIFLIPGKSPLRPAGKTQKGAKKSGSLRSFFCFYPLLRKSTAPNQKTPYSYRAFFGPWEDMNALTRAKGKSRAIRTARLLGKELL